MADPGQLKRAARGGEAVTRALVVWQWSDGKRGHERQCEGLLKALAEMTPVEHHLLHVPSSPLKRLLDFLRGALPALRALPNPDLILGAGRACALPLLAARRARGGRAVYIMRPQLPSACFDLCIVPRHDGVPASPHVEICEGPLNPMRPAAQRETGLGVLLLGGPSAHHDWDNAALRAQIDGLLAAHPEVHWLATDSRRSPADLATVLAANPQIEFHSHRDTAPDWLPELLARAEQVWVSADSVSMIYEALSAGARVGVLEVPARRADRVTAIAADLRARGLVMSTRNAAPVGGAVLREAQRVAALILTRFFSDRAAS